MQDKLSLQRTKGLGRYTLVYIVFAHFLVACAVERKEGHIKRAGVADQTNAAASEENLSTAANSTVAIFSLHLLKNLKTGMVPLTTQQLERVSDVIKNQTEIVNKKLGFQLEGMSGPSTVEAFATVVITETTKDPDGVGVAAAILGPIGAAMLSASPTENSGPTAFVQNSLLILAATAKASQNASTSQFRMSVTCQPDQNRLPNFNSRPSARVTSSNC